MLDAHGKLKCMPVIAPNNKVIFTLCKIQYSPHCSHALFSVSDLCGVKQA